MAFVGTVIRTNAGSELTQPALDRLKQPGIDYEPYLVLAIESSTRQQPRGTGRERA